MPRTNLPNIVGLLRKDETIEMAEMCLAQLSLEAKIETVLRAFGGTPESAFELDELIFGAQAKLDKLETEAKGE